MGIGEPKLNLLGILHQVFTNNSSSYHNHHHHSYPLGVIRGLQKILYGQDRIIPSSSSLDAILSTIRIPEMGFVKFDLFALLVQKEEVSKRKDNLGAKPSQDNVW